MRHVVTCEHAGNRVPREYAKLLQGQRRLLDSHRGWDQGALLVARALAKSLDAPLIAATTTRLLVDPNRSAHNPRVFSAFSRVLSKNERDALLARFHRPHWQQVRSAIGACAPSAIHIAVHSFTPELNGERRPYTFGILYDPKRPSERRFATALQKAIRRDWPDDPVRRNAPYRGDSDGLTTALRREYAPRRYRGIEIELNQGRIRDPQVRRAIAASLAGILRTLSDDGRV